MVYKIGINYESFDYPHDISRIVRVALDHGIVLSPHEANATWIEYFDSMCAGWMNLSDNDSSVWLNLPGWARGEE